MSRWVKFFIAIALGLTTGLIIGWVISPLHNTDITLETLRADYRADFVLMVAEVYHADQNLSQAVQKLAALDAVTPEQAVAETIEYGLRSGFSQSDMYLLQELMTTLKNQQPSSESTQP